MTYYTKDRYAYNRSIFSKPDQRGRSTMVQLFAFKGKASELTHRLSLIENVGAI